MFDECPLTVRRICPSSVCLVQTFYRSGIRSVISELLLHKVSVILKMKQKKAEEPKNTSKLV